MNIFTRSVLYDVLGSEEQWMFEAIVGFFWHYSYHISQVLRFHLLDCNILRCK